MDIQHINNINFTDILNKLNIFYKISDKNVVKLDNSEGWTLYKETNSVSDFAQKRAQGQPFAFIKAHLELDDKQTFNWFHDNFDNFKAIKLIMKPKIKKEITKLEANSILSNVSHNFADEVYQDQLNALTLRLNCEGVPSDTIYLAKKNKKYPAVIFPLFDDDFNEIGQQIRDFLNKEYKVITQGQKGLFIPNIEDLQQSNNLTITSGEIDALTAVLCGFKGVCSLSTEKLNDSQKNILLKLSANKEKIVFFADNDETGNTCSNGISLLFKGKNLKIIKSKNYKDLNDLFVAKKGNKQAILNDFEIKKIKEEIINKEFILKFLKDKNIYTEDHNIELLTSDFVLYYYNIGQFSHTYYQYNDEKSIWEQKNDHIIRELIRGIFEKIINKDITSKKIENALSLLKSRAYTTHGIHIEQKMLNPENRILLKNGVLDLTTFVLTKAKKEDYFLNCLPFSYNDDTDNPTIWLNFLNQTFTSKPAETSAITPEDADEIFNKVPKVNKNSQEIIDLIQEFFGYCLTNQTNYEKFLLLTGAGANGKSRIIETLQTIIGLTNYSTIELKDLSNEQYRANLINKTLNSATDISPSELDSGLFKALVSGEIITSKSVFKEPIQFRNTAKMAFSCNNMPYCKDGGFSIERRLLLIKCENQIAEVNLDPFLQQKINNEAGLIFNWSLIGLKRLKERNKFKIPQQVQNWISNYLKNEDSCQLFLDDLCELKKEKKIKKTDLYGCYTKYCDNNGLRAVSSRKLNERVTNLGISEYRTEACRYYLGVDIR